MSFRIYRFDVLKEIARNGANVVYQARDAADSSAVQLYEWTPLPQETASAAEKLSHLVQQLGGTEAFTSGPRLYVAVSSTGQARKALELLRSHTLFLGVWPGVIEEPSPASEAHKQSESTTAQIKSGVRPRSWSGLFVIAVIVAFLMAAWCIYLLNRTDEVTNRKNSGTTGVTLSPGGPGQAPHSSNKHDISQPEAEAGILQVLQTWVQSFRNRDVIAHAACYAPVIETYFKRHYVVNSKLQRDKQRAFEKMAEVRQYEISDIKISPEADGRYAAIFRKAWDTPSLDGKDFAGEEIQQLVFSNTQTGWKIISEEELQILQVTRGQ